MRHAGNLRSAALGAAAMLVLAVGGCSSANLMEIPATVEDFDRIVLHADKPVLVDFYKDGCAPCGMVEGVMSKLADEYAGRAIFGKFKALNFVFIPPCPEVKDRYNVVLVPDVILFVNGQEKERWFSDFSADNYRKVLDQHVAKAAPATPAPAP